MQRPRRLLFRGMRFDVEAIDIENASGQSHTYQVVVHPGAAVILPLLNDHEVILIRNERYAIGKELWELPAGTLEKGEKPLECAFRELEEETGYKSQTMELLFSFFSTPGFCNEILHIFLAKTLVISKQNLDDSEKIEVNHFKLEKAIEMIQNGEIIDGKTIAALLYYHTFR